MARLTTTDRHDLCGRRDTEVGKMVLLGTRKGLRRVVASTRTSVSLFSLVLGVKGGSHATGGNCDSDSNLPKARTLTNFPRLLGKTPASRTDDNIKIKRAREWSRLAFEYVCGADQDLASNRLNGDTDLHQKRVYIREMPLRRMTKRRQRFNPGRCRDCDLRFSFPRSSRHLPFLSHDTRVDVSRSAVKR